MIISVEDAKKHITTNVDDPVLEAKLQALELLIRKHTNNNFQKRAFRTAGTIEDGDELPSRRVLSALLGVNPNTVQKAYRLLEEEKLIESLQGSKSTMVLTAEKVAIIREELLEADAKGAVQKLKQMGISKAEAIALIERYWEEEYNNGEER